jgi:tryptophan 2,3-dioxygenase
MYQSTPIDGAKLDFADEMSYGDYLDLDNILSAQHPVSPNNDHNEMLFIIQHQATELWMKLMLHELHAARLKVRNNDLAPAFKMMARVSRILEQLIQMWDVLTTLTPSEYLRFRPYLKQASGFQSYQYRAIEFVLGNKNEVMTRPFRHRQHIFESILSELKNPSLYDEAIRLLAQRGFKIDAAMLERDWTKPYAPNDSVLKAWLAIYRDPESYWDLYELAEEFMDLEDSFRQWRFRHLTTVTRVIGYRRGTGGTSGAPYLKQMLEVELFPELWRVRTEL